MKLQHSTQHSRASPIFERLGEVVMRVPEHLLPLVEKLRELSATDRDLVIQAAEALAKQRELPTMPWEEFGKAKGIVSLGGDAVEDCKALYDGDDIK